MAWRIESSFWIKTSHLIKATMELGVSCRLDKWLREKKTWIGKYEENNGVKKMRLIRGQFGHQGQGADKTGEREERKGKCDEWKSWTE